VKRKDAKKYPGNLLHAPTTISQGWSDQNVKPRLEDPLPYKKPVGITDKLVIQYIIFCLFVKIIFFFVYR
jgi:hypothetical protein